MNLARSIFAACGFALSASASFAADYSGSATPQHPSIVPAFSQLDVDRDGLISMAEARADSGVASAFARADADRSGALTPAEFHSAMVLASDSVPGAPPMVAPQASVNELFERYDANNDDRIGPQEAKADINLDRWFEWADRNNTNSLDRAEFEEAVIASSRQSAPPRAG